MTIFSSADPQNLLVDAFATEPTKTQRRTVSVNSVPLWLEQEL